MFLTQIHIKLSLEVFLALPNTELLFQVDSNTKTTSPDMCDDKALHHDSCHHATAGQVLIFQWIVLMWNKQIQIFIDTYIFT